MIQFRQKEFSEYDAMRYLVTEIYKRTQGDKRKFPIITPSAMIPILKGNNIVVEKFTIYSPMIGKDRYRMYLKIGAKAKLPDEVRLPSRTYDKSLGSMSVNFNGSIKSNPTDNKKSMDIISSRISPNIELSRRVTNLLGDAVKYDKPSRSLVLEFDNVNSAIDALNILPFGINYKIYLLDA